MFSAICQANIQAMLNHTLIRDTANAYYERKAIQFIFKKGMCSGTELSVHLQGRCTPSKLLDPHIQQGNVIIETNGRFKYYSIKPGLIKEDFGL